MWFCMCSVHMGFCFGCWKTVCCDMFVGFDGDLGWDRVTLENWV